MSTRASTDPAAFAAAYEASDRQLRLRHARVGCVLALVLMPAGTTLDWFVYPDLVWSILQARLLTDVFIAGVLLLLAHPWGQKRIRVLGSAWALACAVAISWMIAISEGAASPYYAGLNLVVIIACLLMPYTLREAAVVCGLVIGMYLVACLAHQGDAPGIRVLYNNLYFLVLTAIIAVTSCHYYNLRRIEDFRLRHELDARNRELAELDRLKSEFFANISHELRTPLTLILAPVEDLLQRREALPANAVDALTLTKQNALRLLKLINDLLEAVRLDTRHSRPQRQMHPLDLSPLVRGLVGSVKHLADAKGVTLTTEAPDGPMVVRGDASGLEKVVLNLLTNAVKFTPRGGSVRVRCAAEGDQARIEVSDTGIGIPEPELPRIFDRFRQVDGSATRKYQGVGIGLALVRELVEEHGGKIAVHSAIGKGTTFVVRLPRSENQAARTEEAPEADPMVRTLREADRFSSLDDGDGDGEAKPAEVGTGEHRVLVVDDEPDMRRFLVSLLAQEYRVLQAADGEAGLSRAKAERPDLIVLDLMLPGMDGLEVCRRLRQDASLSDTKIVLLTARADEESKLTALERGADDFLTKPFSSVEVQTRLRNLLRAAELQRGLRQRNEELQATNCELAQTRAQLVQSEKMNALGSLAAGLLHEINNPLNYAMTAVSLAQQEVDHDEGLREVLDDIDEGMKRIRDIITDLRAFAYPDRAGQREPIELGPILETALRFTSSEGAMDVVELDLAADAAVLGSRTQLTQVFVNLLTNALRAVQAAGGAREPRVRIRSAVAADRLRISVWDNGVGIAPEDLARVLDPFFTTRDVGQGMGLGLSICHTIIAAHGGSLSVSSEHGAWTEVTFELPLATAEAVV